MGPKRVGALLAVAVFAASVIVVVPPVLRAHADAVDASGRYNGTFVGTNPKAPGNYCETGSSVPAAFEVTQDGAHLEVIVLAGDARTTTVGSIKPDLSFVTQGGATLVRGKFGRSGSSFAVAAKYSEGLAPDCNGTFDGGRTTSPPPPETTATTGTTPPASTPPATTPPGPTDEEQLLETLDLGGLDVACTKAENKTRCDEARQGSEAARQKLVNMFTGLSGRDFDSGFLSLELVMRLASLRTASGASVHPAIASLLRVFIRLGDRMVNAADSGDTAEVHSLSITITRLFALAGKAELDEARVP